MTNVVLEKMQHFRNPKTKTKTNFIHKLRARDWWAVLVVGIDPHCVGDLVHTSISVHSIGGFFAILAAFLI
jgi:hypothetical protein